jgi:lipopolysaccharide/colanic/teichoic acid biosynthesis glycosyltransferase
MKQDNYIHPATMMAKRSFDVIGASIGLLLTLPFFPLIMLATKMNSPGPIFFKQLRIGKIHSDRVDLIYMIKFRTMRCDAESTTGPVWATENDSRLTAVGKFLRKTRLDEIPQFINVLRGDMSLIGPRPERPGICDKLENAIPFYVERTYGLAPGITGLAQINQGYDSDLDDVRSKLAYDLAYSISLTKPLSWLYMDLGIVFKTVWVMACGRGQ